VWSAQLATKYQIDLPFALKGFHLGRILYLYTKFFKMIFFKRMW
jgi:hypothetical protein